MEKGNSGAGRNRSNVEQLTSESVKEVIEKNGLDINEFSESLAPNRTLSSEELKIVNKVRSDIGLPGEGTIMNKTIPQSDLYKYLNGDYDSVRGFVSVDQHSSSLLDLKTVYEGNRLDYKETLIN